MFLPSSGPGSGPFSQPGEWLVKEGGQRSNFIPASGPIPNATTGNSNLAQMISKLALKLNDLKARRRAGVKPSLFPEQQDRYITL